MMRRGDGRQPATHCQRCRHARTRISLAQTVFPSLSVVPAAFFLPPWLLNAIILYFSQATINSSVLVERSTLWTMSPARYIAFTLHMNWFRAGADPGQHALKKRVKTGAAPDTLARHGTGLDEFTRAILASWCCAGTALCASVNAI